MKILGLVFLFTACVSLGFLYCENKKRRLRTLRELVNVLERMEGELGTNNLPLPDLCVLLACNSRGAVKSFFESVTEKLSRLGELSFAEMWGQAVMENLTEVSEMDRDALRQLGSSLGRYQLTQQLNALDSCRRMLYRSLEEAERMLPNQQKLGLGLAVSAGILFWIVWI